MELVFQSSGNAGHLSAIFHPVKEDPINNDYSYEIRVEFHIAPTGLPHIKKELTDLLK